MSTVNQLYLQSGNSLCMCCGRREFRAETCRLTCAWCMHFPSSLLSDIRLVTQNGSISFFGDVELLSTASHPLLGASSSKTCWGSICAQTHQLLLACWLIPVGGCSWQGPGKRGGRADRKYMTPILGGKTSCFSPNLRAISERGTNSEGFLLMHSKVGTNHTSSIPFCPLSWNPAHGALYREACAALWKPLFPGGLEACPQPSVVSSPLAIEVC